MNDVNKRFTQTTSQSVRKRLRRDITLFVLLLIALFLALSYFYSKQIQKDLSISAIENAQNLVIDEIKGLFEPISNTLSISKKWAQLESLTPEDFSTFNKRFIPLMETLPQISGVLLASSDGREYYFSRHDNQWLSRYIKPGANPGPNKVATWKRWDGNNRLLKEWQENTNYQLKSRPWYQLGLSIEPNQPFQWTRPYSFYTQQVPGVTGVTRWVDKNNMSYILAFDVTLSNVAKTLDSAPVGQNTNAFLISPNGEVILPPGNKHVVKGTQHSGSLYAPANDRHNYVIFDSVNDWMKKGNALGVVDTFEREGQTWWYQMFSLSARNQPIYAAVVVAEKSLAHILNEKLLLLISAILCLTILAVVMANFLVKKYSHQLKDVPKTHISKDNFSDEIYQLLRMGESETLEFKSTMRLNLKSGKNGKEIEIAWLKGLVGFMNTHGGILLIGVDDDANILGIEADKFENEDKIRLHFKNLLSQHIGLEFSNYINLTIDRIDGKTLLVIECERANRPVFLFNKNEEEFYIRSGPASVKLSISKILRYIQNRF